MATRICHGWPRHGALLLRAGLEQRARGPGATAIELSDAVTADLLPLPARNERGEGWGEGKSKTKCPSSPQPSLSGRRGPGSTAVELSDAATADLLPLPARNERGEGRREGKSKRKCPSSPQPSCMFLFIFLVRLKAEQEDGAAFPPAGGKAAARARSLPSGTLPRSWRSRSRSCLCVRTRTVDGAVTPPGAARSNEQVRDRTP